MKLRGPEYIQLYPTLKCNKDCGFCFNKGLPSEGEISLKEYSKMLDILSLQGIRYIDIMGGEPFLVEDLTRIVRYTLQRGLRLNISTNAKAKERLRSFLSEFSGRVNIGISINSIEDLHDTKEIIKGYSTITKSLYRKPFDEELLGFIIAISPSKHYLIYPDNLKAPENKELSVAFFEFYLNYKKRYEGQGISIVYCGGFIPDGSYINYRCPAGTTKLGIMPDGSVYPCNLFFGVNDFLLGNILTDDFDRIWNNPVLEEFRHFKTSACPLRECLLYKLCRGGCPAHSLFVYGRLHGPDPRCLGAYQFFD
ncbi:MAG: radical SAM protein [Nitrospirae bacterium]|nr:radical SAM protein [Nitrospirota bacterium]